LKALYRWEVVGDPLPEIAAEIEREDALPEEVRTYAVHLVTLVMTGVEEVDRLLRKALTRWSLERLAVVDRSILRLGASELLFEPGLATGIILDESIEIAKKFGSDRSGPFVNGVLDGVAKMSRSGEDQAPSPREIP